jgi:hypothetical protein
VGIHQTKMGVLIGITLWQTNSVLSKMAIEIVDLPIKKFDFPSFFVCLPEGKYPMIHPRCVQDLP